MLERGLNIKETLLTKKQNSRTYLLIVALFIIFILLEYSTPSEYVFGYFYAVPILLASLRLNRPITLPITLGAVALTLLNLFIPLTKAVDFVDITNRLIAGAALVTTGLLANISRQRYEKIIVHQEAELKFQEQIAHIREDFVYTLTRDLKAPLLGQLKLLKLCNKVNLVTLCQIKDKY
jgi:two-component system NarL family sensor kinase